MSDSDRLNVWHEQRLVGELWRNQIGAIGFHSRDDTALIQRCNASRKLSPPSAGVMPSNSVAVATNQGQAVASYDIVDVILEQAVVSEARLTRVSR